MSHYDIRFDDTNDIVVVKHIGTWSRERANAVLPEIEALCEQHAVGVVLIDHRQTHLELDTFGIFERAKEVSQSQSRGPVRKLALLYPPDMQDAYGFFETALRNRGVDTRVFADDEHGAIAWLQSG